MTDSLVLVRTNFPGSDRLTGAFSRCLGHGDAEIRKELPLLVQWIPEISFLTGSSLLPWRLGSSIRPEGQSSDASTGCDVARVAMTIQRAANTVANIAGGNTCDGGEGIRKQEMLTYRLQWT